MASLILICWSEAIPRREFRKRTSFFSTCYVKLSSLGLRDCSRFAACHAEVPWRQVRSRVDVSNTKEPLQVTLNLLTTVRDSVPTAAVRLR